MCLDSCGANLSRTVLVDQTITIFSTHDISVHGLLLSPHGNLAGGFLALPTNNLGDEYIIDCYAPLRSSSKKAQIAVSAIYNDTELTIQGQNISICLASTGQIVTTRLSLQSNESVLLETCESGTSLALTHINSSNMISVVVGASPVRIPYDISVLEKGFVIEQFSPIAAWGCEYIVPPFHDAINGWLVRIMARYPGTKVSLTGCGSSTSESLDQQTYKDVVSEDVSSVCTIVADKPIQVIQYMRSSLETESGDPSMVVIPPVSGLRSSTILLIPDTGNTLSSHADIIFSQSGNNELFINDEPISGGTTIDTLKNNYTYQTVTLKPGVYNLIFSTPPSYLYVRTYSNSSSFGAILTASATAVNGKLKT